jgi:hypothetical protein
MKTSVMPKINLANIDLTADELALVAGIVNSKTGELRAGKPTLPKMVKVNDPAYFMGYSYCYQTEADRNQGRTAYIWRMVAFFVSPKSQHQCMPCTADFDLDGSPSETREEAKRLDAIVDKVVDSLPKSQWHGVRRWGQAFGMTGTPQYNEEGAIIYR